jgi:2-keto-3-deoxy-L-rhamnonate aldolase RhmA
MPLGIFAADVPMARRYLQQGFTLIALGMDAFFLWQSAQEALESVLGRASDDPDRAKVGGDGT